VKYCEVFCSLYPLFLLLLWLQGSVIFRVERDRVAWGAMFEIMRQFWFEHLVPARHALAAEGYTPETLKSANLVLPHEPSWRNARGGFRQTRSRAVGEGRGEGG